MAFVGSSSSVRKYEPAAAPAKRVVGMVVTMPARRRDLRSCRYLSQLRWDNSRLDEGEDDEDDDELAENRIGDVGLKVPLLLLLLLLATLEEVDRARWLDDSMIAERDEDAPAERAAYLAAAIATGMMTMQ